MTTLEVLKAARAKIEKGWTQGAMARDKNGVALSCSDQDAACWCVMGATMAVTHDIPTTNAAIGFLRLAVGDFAPRWNDTPGRTQAEVLAAFDKAIELCEKESQ